jgi:peptidoglycan hydrolase-like protein with peptidoglycan-binding domain
MKQALTLAVALAAGIGFASTGFAYSPGQAAAPSGMNGAQAAQTQQLQTASEREGDVQTVRQVQQHLQQRGLYDGEIDGIYGPLTQQAILDFQQQHGLPQTATLDDMTLNQLTGAPIEGVGSGIAPAPGQAPALGGNGAAAPADPNLQR